MTPDREGTLEEALRPFANEADKFAAEWSWQRRVVTLTWSPDLTVGDFRRAKTALASPAQEPAPSAEVKEMALFLPLDIAQEIALACANELMQIGPQICLFPRSRSEAIIARHVASALRRYAGDGGVTAIFQVSPTEGQLYGSWLDVSKNIYDISDRPETYSRRIVYVPAARAKSGEKGGAK